MTAKAIEGGEGGKASGLYALVYRNHLVRNQSVLSRFKHAARVVGHHERGGLNM